MAKAGASPASFSRVVVGRIVSSSVTFAPSGVLTGTISAVNRPDSRAAAASWCERAL